MKPDSAAAKTEITLRALYPTLSERELEEAERNLTRYLEVAWEICREFAPAASAVDSSGADSMINDERSNCSQKI